jgi:HlyD family type I secretion membrane fusion protein
MYSLQSADGAQMETVRALGMREGVVRRELKARVAMSKSQTATSRSSSTYSASTKFIRLVMQSAALGLGVVLALRHDISSGAIIAASILTTRAFAPIEMIVGSWAQIEQGRQSYVILRKVLETQEGQREHMSLPDPAGALALENVSIRAPSGDRPILMGANFKVPPGEIVGVVGPSGAGKSTLLRAIAGAIPVDQGAVRIDGAKLTDWDSERLGRFIGYAPQDIGLLPGTIAENIGRFEARNDDIDRAIVRAAQAVGAHEMVLSLAQGYDTEIGAGGRGLSTGQAQRVALARALFRDPTLIVLDEPNAHLDADGETALINALKAARARGVRPTRSSGGQTCQRWRDASGYRRFRGRTGGSTAMTDVAFPVVVDDSGRSEMRAGVIAILLFFGGFLGWAAFAPLDAAVVAPGVIVVSGSRQTLQHPDGGVVSRLAVQDGDHVRQGQVLIELASPELVAQERALLSQVVDFEMQRERLNAEQNHAVTLERPAEWASLPEEDREIADAAFQRNQNEVASGEGSLWSEYDARIAGYRGEIAAIGQQEASLHEELTGMQQLAAEQLVPLTRVRTLERSLSDLQGRRSELSASIAATQEDRLQQIRTVDAKLAELTPQLAGARERLERTRLRAPVAGVVVALSIHTVGGVIRPGERVLDIVPENGELVVEAQVQPKDVDGLTAGMPTEVRFSAFHGRNMPLIHGRVVNVSADRLTDERTGHPYFLMRVVVPPEELRRLADPAAGDRHLRAGLDSSIVVPMRKRTALQFLLEPVNQALWRSMREE